MYFLLNMGIFHCYVSLPEGNYCAKGPLLLTFIIHHVQLYFHRDNRLEVWPESLAASSKSSENNPLLQCVWSDSQS